VEADPECMTAYAVRSSAYQKLGNLDAALKDANMTIENDVTYVRGYIRKACVLRAMKLYSEEVDSYLKGLEHCPNDEALQKGLQMARRLKTATSKASQAARTTQATLDAALSRSHKANQAADLKTFTAQTKWNLELQMVSLQAQLEIVAEMEHLSEAEKMDLLYQLLATKVVTGNVLVESLKQASTNLPFSGAIEAALNEVTAPSAYAVLERTEFETFVKAIVAHLDASLSDFAEFIVYQVLFVHGVAEVAADDAGMSEAADVVAEAAPKSILNDPRMKALFVLFDKDADATVDFKEVAIGLYPLTNSMEASAKQAAGLLLMMDKNDQRVMSYDQFAKLIMGVAAAMKMSFDELADQLTLALTNGSDVSEAVMAEIFVEEKAYEAALEKKQQESAKKTLDALSYSRTQKLFTMWDANGDGDIDFQELLSGLRKYQKSVAGGTGSASIQEVERDALMIMGHDKDSNQTLDTEEFAWAMANYAEAIKTDLHELIDFMCVVSSQEDTTAYETFYTQATAEAGAGKAKSRLSTFKLGLGTILDVEGGDDSEEEEDDW
jgi:Ca2+-binding EF-hand superfamily protein